MQEILSEMERIDALIEDPNIYYDPYKIEGFIRFCEREMTLTDGSPLHMLFTFKLWAEQVFCWYYFVEKSVYTPNPDGPGGEYQTRIVKKQLTTKQYLIVSRGSAKSIYSTLIHAYFMTVNTRTTHQVTTAPTMKQAEEVMSPFRTAVTRARGPYFKFLTEGRLETLLVLKLFVRSWYPQRRVSRIFLLDHCSRCAPCR